MKSFIYEIRCAIVIELFHLALFFAPKESVFGTVTAQGLHNTMKYLKQLEDQGWLAGK